jgi:hypothetical protein
MSLAMHALLVTYSLRDSTSAQHAELCQQLAPAVAAVPGLISETWLASSETGRYGGFYVFDSRGDFDRFVASELFDTLSTLASVCGVAASDFSVVESPTAGIDRPPNRPEEVN